MVLRILEGHAAAGPILVFLFRPPDRHAYRKEIEHEMYLQPLTAIRTIDFLMRNKLITERLSVDERTNRPLRFYSLTKNGRRIAEILNETETALDAERKAGTIPADLEG